jgi:hypothetical protein
MRMHVHRGGASVKAAGKNPLGRRRDSLAWGDYGEESAYMGAQ